MGWTSFHFTGTKAEFLQQEFNEPTWGTIIDHAVKGSVIYCAVKMGSKHAEREGKIFAMVILTSTRMGNFAFKDMSESCGPCECNCPKRIIALLSPLDELYETDSCSYTWAKEWRERCTTIVAKPKAVKVNEGDIIKLNAPVKTSFGISFQYFKKTARTNCWVPIIEREGKLEPTSTLIKFRQSRFQFSLVG